MPMNTRGFINQVTRSAPLPFDKMFRLSGLDPKLALVNEDLSGFDFARCDLSGFNFTDVDLTGSDFTGARLINCSFEGARITGARFEHALIDTVRPYAKLDPARTDLSAAADFDAYVKTWQRAATPPADEHLPVGAIFQDAPFAPEMVVVPAGKFMMGTSAAEMVRLSRDYGPRYGEWVQNEGPQKKITFAEPFAVGRFAVTANEWRSALEYIGKKFNHSNRWGQGRIPVTGVSMLDAVKYISLLTKETGYHYRLLSESEWEYCCRANTETRYNTGTDIDQTLAHAHFGRTRVLGVEKNLTPVGSYPANAWGLHDMHGSVLEWCAGEFENDYINLPVNGTAIKTQGSGQRQGILRGGSWNMEPQFLRSAYRRRNLLGHSSNDVGVRVARSLVLRN
jgi:formylglycine-generating enzyme required for sulfatase activity